VIAVADPCRCSTCSDPAARLEGRPGHDVPCSCGANGHPKAGADCGCHAERSPEVVAEEVRSGFPHSCTCKTGKHPWAGSPPEVALVEFQKYVHARGVVTPAVAQLASSTRATRARPRVEVEVVFAASERCGDFYRERRPRTSFVDLCLLPWAPPPAGTFVEVHEPPQSAPPPWGFLPLGPPRPPAWLECQRKQRSEQVESPWPS